MAKKWKVFISCILLLISYSIYEISKVNTHIDLIGQSLSSYNMYEDYTKTINLINADNAEKIKKTLIELSDETGVSFALSHSESLQDCSPKYYWYLQDEKYLNTDTGLNKNISLEEFNSLSVPITNHEEDEYHFSFPLDTYSYNIYPFELYDRTNLSTDIKLFSESEQKIGEFIHAVGAANIIYNVDEDPPHYKNSFLQSLLFILFQNPLAPLTFGLFLIAVFAFIYQDRHNLLIKLVNGYSKTQYMLEMNKKLLILEAITFIGSFFIYYLISFKINFTYFKLILMYYLPIILVINFITILYSAIIIYSFTDINQDTYVQGVKPKAFTSFIVGGAKFIMGFLIYLSLIPSIIQIIDSTTIYKIIEKQTDKYKDIYLLDTSGDYFTSMIEKSDEIIGALGDFDNFIFIQPAYSLGGEETKYKVIYVNDNYIKKHPILDKNKNPIDPNKKNVVYTKSNNLEGVEYLKLPGSFLCESEDNCLDVEVVLLDEDAELIFYSDNPFLNDEEISQDFVLAPRSENLFILQFFFIFENNNQMDEARDRLKGIVDIESISFRKVIDSWEQELSYQRNKIIKDAVILMNYLIIIVILSLIYYQIKFDKVRRDFCIYWVNGISKFNKFYKDYFSQIILNGVMILLVRRFFYREISTNLIIVLFLIFIAIDTISLFVFRNRFYTQLQKNIKEQI